MYGMRRCSSRGTNRGHRSGRNRARYGLPVRGLREQRERPYQRCPSPACAQRQGTKMKVKATKPNVTKQSAKTTETEHNVHQGGSWIPSYAALIYADVEPGDV